jgi:Bifunctional DNA primase/polymerase, N-terminal/Primase C terminal 1 (PriCT-1)
VAERTNEAAAGAMLVAALRFAEQGIPVFPVHSPNGNGGCSCGNPDCSNPAKHPRTRHGFRDATTDPETITAWWTRWPSANLAMPTGAASGRDVLDVDVQHGGAGTLQQLEREHGKLPPTAEVLTPSGGRHYQFAHQGRTLKSTAGSLGAGLDSRGEGGFALVPPSVGANGRAYKWMRAPEKAELAAPPDWLFEVLEEQLRFDAAPKVEEIIPEGKRRQAMLSVAGSMRRRGLSGAEILPALTKLNERCRPPLDRRELEEIASDVGRRYQPHAATAIETTPELEPRPVEEVVATFSRWLWLPDTTPVYAALGTVAANRLEGAPVWTLFVGPPGSGKTETLNALLTLPDVYATAVLSEAALLSGTPRKDRAKEARGGLLRELGEFGIILCKDFGSLLSMRQDALGPVLAALREVYDGAWTRYVGSEGGLALSWKGKAGLVGGCTPSIDRRHGVIAAMGDRFLLFRMPLTDPEHQAAASLAHPGEREAEMRRDLGESVAALFAGELDLENVGLVGDELEELVGLSTLVARCRSGVERDRHSREIELVPDPEAPARLAKTLERLLAGLVGLGVERPAAWQVVRKAALDSMPALRRAVMDVLVRETSDVATTAVAEVVQHPTSTTRRALEDLTAHGVLLRHPQGKGKADTWEASEWLRGRYR